MLWKKDPLGWSSDYDHEQEKKNCAKVLLDPSTTESEKYAAMYRYGVMLHCESRKSVDDMLEEIGITRAREQTGDW